MSRLSFLKGFAALLLLCIISFSSIAQNSVIQKVEPLNWWVGMNNPNLQLIVYGDNLAGATVEIKYDHIKLKEVIQVENPNYLFLNIEIGELAKAGIMDVIFKKNDKQIAVWNYELMEREENSAKRAGFDNSDVIYLLMPDRFANGDPNNDSHSDTYEKADRNNHDGRHGGDLQGIYNHLDYVKETGFTTIWMNPFLENNQKKYSYHGYAISDFYNVDPRMGTNDSFKKLVDESHDKGLKIVMDMIFNHCGIAHWWVDDLPMNDWFHQFDSFTRSNFRASTITDPNASEYDKTRMLSGWFDTNMPDLNQHNPFLATYLIQNSIWWVEFSGLDGIRMDTQPYPYKDFMANWAEAVLYEYPDFSLVGEVWIDKPSMVSYYLGDALNHDGYNSNLPHVFDFPLYYAISKGFNEPNGWSEGVSRLYDLFAEDFLYSDPSELVVFMDNHDLNRIFTSFNEDMDKLKMAMATVATVRGIPMFYYGTEIAMTGYEHHGHGHIRTDFPGGWDGDERNAFTSNGRTEIENEAYNYMSNLLNWRKTNNAIHQGEFKHYLPQDGIYVYFRYLDDEAVMVILNKNDDKKSLDLTPYQENLKGYTIGKDVLKRDEVNVLKNIKLTPMSATIIELKK